MQAKRGCLATALGYDVSDNPPCAVSSIARVSFDVIRSYFEIKDRLLTGIVPKLEGVLLCFHDGQFLFRRQGTSEYTGKTTTPRAIRFGQKHWNVLQLIVSCVYTIDLTQDETRVLIFDGDLVVERNEDRQCLINNFVVNTPRREIVEFVSFKTKRHYDFRGCGYVIEDTPCGTIGGTNGGTNGGLVVYNKNGTRLSVGDDNKIFLMTGSTKEPAAVKLPQLAVYVFRDLYPGTFDPDKHTEVDHINGNHKDNRLCNLRPVTRLQNMMLKVKGKNPNVPTLRTDASHLTALANHPPLHSVSETRMKQFVQDGDAVVVQTKVFHRAGLVYKRKGATWVPLKPTLLRNEYLTTKLDKKHQYIAPIIARAFVSNPDESANVKNVTFKDGNKHNLAATNLEWV